MRENEETPFWLQSLELTARNPAMMNEQIIPISNEGTYAAVYGYIATLRTALADARREREEAVLRVQHVGMECADKLIAAERDRDAMAAVVEAAEAYIHPPESDPWGYGDDERYDALRNRVQDFVDHRARAKEGAKIASPNHVCGLQGYDPMVDPTCKACEKQGSDSAP